MCLLELGSTAIRLIIPVCTSVYVKHVTSEMSAVEINQKKESSADS